MDTQMSLISLGEQGYTKAEFNKIFVSKIMQVVTKKWFKPLENKKNNSLFYFDKWIIIKLSVLLFCQAANIYPH